MTDIEAHQPDQPPSQAAMIRMTIEKQSSAFKAVLPSHVDSERYTRLVISAVKATPKLKDCFDSEEGSISVLLAAMEAATVGLEPNTPIQEAWLLPRQRKVRAAAGVPEHWITECELSIGYRGLLKLARRTGTIKTIFAEVVREGDHFEWSRGLADDKFEHTPGPSDDRGALTHAYAVARFKDGGYSFVVLDEAEVHARRAMSDSWKNERARQYSPWEKWTAAMWRKSAIRALVPYLELSPEAARAVDFDERALSLDGGEVVAAVRESLEVASGPGRVTVAEITAAESDPVAAEEAAVHEGTPGPVKPTEAELRALLKKHKVLVSDLLRMTGDATVEDLVSFGDPVAAAQWIETGE